DLEYEFKRTDGSRFWALVSARLIDYKGEQAIVSTTRDLTERKALEAEQARQREILHQSEKINALGGLLAGVA
nr:PAS domain S-box protein [Desulfuromonadales bacterium]